jgi:hypothetical protein
MAAGTTKTRSKSTNGRKRTGKTSSSNGSRSTPSEATTAGGAALAGTKAAGKAVGAAVSKAKGPLLAAGVATAGVVGGLAIAGRRSRSKSRLRLPSLDIDRAADAAKRVGAYGQQVADIADAVQTARKSGRK